MQNNNSYQFPASGCMVNGPYLKSNIKRDIKESAALVNSLRGAITINEARIKILGWEALDIPEGDQLLE